MARDSQRQAVYNWGVRVRSKFGALTLTLEECQELINKVYDDYKPGAKPPKAVRKQQRRGPASYYPYEHKIVLPQWARNELTVLHEVAHAIAGPNDGAWHGPVFAALLIQLWVEYLDLPRPILARLAIPNGDRQRRVYFAEAASTPRKPRAAWRRWRFARDNLRRELREHEKAEPDKYDAG